MGELHRLPPSSSFQTYQALPGQNTAELKKAAENNKQVEVMVSHGGGQVIYAGEKINIAELAATSALPAYQLESLDSNQDGYLEESELKWNRQELKAQVDDKVQAAATQDVGKYFESTVNARLRGGVVAESLTAGALGIGLAAKQLGRNLVLSPFAKVHNQLTHAGEYKAAASFSVGAYQVDIR